jgi:tetratricopeptide (TPR) repeat protein
VNTIQQIETLISQGRYLEAQQGAEALINQGSNLRLDQLYALALSKSGAPEEAQRYIEPVYRNYQEDAETAGIMGSIYKAMFRKNQQTSFAVQSRDTYLKNFAATRNHYTGINAASMSAMIMQGSKSKEIARQVISIIHPDSTDFWELATLGEAYLLTKESEKSIEHYIKARKVAGNDWGKISSVYDQLWLLNHYLPVQKEIMRIFSPPGVVAFVGHMIDHPSRQAPRFPPSIEKQVKESIVSNLMTINAHIGFCSLACGSDILFAESMAGLNRELNIFLPFRIRDFIEVSLKFAGETWVDRFTALIESHPVKIISDDSYSGYDSLFNFQSKIIFGSALLRSQSQQNRTTLLTVLSETDRKKKIGGTNYSLSLWPFRAKHVNINPDLFVSGGVVNNSSAVPQSADQSLPHRKIWHHMAIDVSGLTPLFIDKLHKEVVRLNSDALPFRSTEISKVLTVYSFESEFAAFDLMTHVESQIKTFPKGEVPSIHFHSGLTSETNGTFSGEGIETIIELSELNIPGIRATENVAAMLALQANQYNLEFAGVVVLKSKNKLAIYRIGKQSGERKILTG